MKKLLFLLIAIIFISCKKESQDDHIDAFPVEVRDNVRAFLQAGSDRGVKLDIKKIKHIYLSGRLKKIGGCDVDAYYSHDEKSIFIDTSRDDYRNNAEVIIFHELGHGLLLRDHKNELFADGVNPVSIMHISPSVEINDVWSFRKSYYFDELFNQSTPYPAWAL